MAKKENLASGKTDLDSNFDNFDFDFDAPPIKDDRSPITKLAAGALSGAKTAASDEAFIRESIKTVLPDGYGSALDLQDEISKKSKELYNNAAKEVKPIVGEMARAADKLLPSGAARLKGKLADIDKWSKGNEQKFSQNSKEDNEKASIAASITETFKFQMQQEAKETNRTESREKLQEGLALTRHKDSFGMLNRINLGITRLAQYQDRVTASYQKKSLELQYRSLFTSIDILEESKRQNAFTTQALTSINKNTGLPDFVKLSESDRLEGLLRNKFAKTIGKSILGGKDNPLTTFSAHIEKVFNEKLKDLTSILSSSAEVLTAIGDGKEDLKNEDKFKTAGTFLGQEGAKFIRDKAGPVFEKIIPKFVKDKAKGQGSKVDGLIKNRTQYLDDFKTGNVGEQGGGGLAKLVSFFKEFIPSLGVSTTLEKDRVEDLTKPAIYTKQTNKSINEIIPGYLSMIFRELQITRTGDTKIGLTVYDNQSNKFHNKIAADKNLLKSIITKDTVDSTNYQLKSLLDLVNPEDPAKKLSAKAGTALAKKTLRDNLAGKLGTASRTAHDYTYLSDETTKPYAKEIAEAMQMYFGSNKSGEIKDNTESHDKQNAFTARQRNLGSKIPDARGQIQNQINLGNYESLERLGLIKYSSTGEVEIDLEKIIEYSTGGQYNPEDEQLTASVINKKVSTKEDRVTQQARNKLKSRAAMSGGSSTGFVSRKNKQEEVEQQPQQIYQQSNNTDLIKMLSESSVKEEMTQAVSTLDKIQQILLESNVAQEAYFTNLIENVRAIGFSTINSANNSAATPGDKTNNGNVFQGSSINLKNFLGKTTKALGSVFSFGKKANTVGLKASAPILQTGVKFAKSALDTVGTLLDKVGQRVDLFVKGEEIPRIKSELLEKLKYFNKLGKPFKNIDDINDTVYDENGKIVITKEELRNSYFRFDKGSGLYRIVKFAANKLSDAASFGSSLIPPAFKMVTDTGKFILNKIENLLDQPEDIYIRGVRDPVMLKRTMIAGGYFLMSNMTVIKRPSQITGTVINAEKDVVLSEEDLRSGIFGKNGQPIKFTLEKLAYYAGNVVKLGINAAGYLKKKGKQVLDAGLTAGKKAMSFGSKLLTGGLSAFKDKAQSAIESLKEGLAGDNTQTLNVLERIFSVLDSRLPAKANRKGSWKDDRTKKDRPNKAADPVNAASKGSLGDGLLAKGKGIIDKITGKSEGGSINIDNSKTAGPKPAEPKKGFFGKAKGMLGGKVGGLLGSAALLGAGAATAGSEPGSIGSAVSTGLDIAGTVSTIYNIGKFILPAAEVAGATLGAGATTGGVVAAGSVLGGTALTAGAGVVAAEAAGGAAIAAGGAGIGASILTGLGALATGIGAIIGSPVVLGALAIAAVGTAAYFTYEYFKKTEYLKNLRYIQYGFSEKNTTGFYKAYFLEESLKDALYFKEGVASIDPKKFDQKQAISLFEINADDSKAVSKWLYWFQERFKPVFLTHITALRTVDDKAKIKDVDDLQADKKDKFLELVKFQEGPYQINLNPVSGSNYQMTGSKDVTEAFDKARKGIDAEMKKKKDKSDSIESANSKETQYDALGNVTGTVDKDISIAGNASKTGKLLGKDYTKDSAAISATGSALAISGIAGTLPTANTIDLLEGIRMRAYGLTTMESDKVSALRKLENLIITKVQYDGDGKATYKADSIDTIVAGGMFFGVTSGSELADNWSKWFQTRFLPVYLSYLGLVKQNAGAALKANTTPSLTALQALSIGTQISSLDSVWSVKDSPWSLYKLGTDQAIVKDLIESLRLNSKQAVMPEAATVRDNVSSSSVSNTDNKDTTVKAAINNKNSNNDKPATGGQDAENVEMNRAPIGSPESLNGVSGLSLAGGPLSDGRNASAFLKIATGATTNGLNPEFLKNFNGLVDEYGTLTGNSTLLNSGFRTSEKQAALYKADPTKAAPPGSSLHEFGLAVDVQSSILDDMDKRGLLRKYGFTRPVGGEPWHLEATGIQNDINGFKRDPNLAAQAIAAGVGKGGGGYGTMTDATKYKRNNIVAKQILDAAVSPTNEQVVKPVIPDKAQIAGTVQAGVPNTLGKYIPTFDEIVNGAVPVDSEAPITAGSNAAGTTKSQIYGNSPNGRTANARAFDPTITATSTKSSIYGNSPNTRGGTGNMMPALQNATIGTGAKYDTIPSPAGGAGWIANKDMIISAANAVGVDPKYMAAIGAIESDFNPNASAGGESSAKGLNQFVNDTWKEQMQKNSAKYGIPPGASVFDPKANALLGAAYVKQNLSALSGAKPDITGTDVYMAHFLGAAGAKRFLGADPNAIAAQVMPEAAAKNIDIFYDRKNANRPRTIGEIYSLLNNRMQTKLQGLGVDSAYIPAMAGLVAKNMSTTGLEIRTPTLGLNANAPSMPGATNPSNIQMVDINGKPTTTPQSAPTVASMVSPMADIGGFNMQNMQQPIQNPKQDMNAAMGDVGTTLTKSLDVQTRMLQALETIVKMNGSASPLQQPLQQGAQRVQTTDNQDNRSESQRQNEQAVRSYNVNANKIDVPVPMNRV